MLRKLVVFSAKAISFPLVAYIASAMFNDYTNTLAIMLMAFCYSWSFACVTTFSDIVIDKETLQKIRRKKQNG